MDDGSMHLALSLSQLDSLGVGLEWIVMAIVWAFILAAKIVGFVLVLCLGWVVRETWPAFYENIQEGVRERTLLNLCSGALAQLACTIVAAVLVITIVGIPLAIIAITSAIVVSAVGFAVVAQSVGARLPMATLAGHPERQLVMGLVVLLAASLVPILGDALLMAALTVGTGAVIMALLATHGRGARTESVITY